MKHLFIVISILATFTSCNEKTQEATVSANAVSNSVELTEAQLQLAKIETGKIEQKVISSILKTNGRVDVPPQNMITISAQLGGYLKSTKLMEGMQVKKGEVIAVMEDQQYIQLQQEYLTAKAHFGSLEKEFQRQKELNETKASSDKVFENSQAEYLSQKILIRALAERLQLINIDSERLSENSISRTVNIYSPIDGYVASVKANIGKYVNPTDPLFELVDPSDIHLVLTVFEKDLAKLFVGQKLEAYTNNEPQKKYACEIILIGKDISSDRSGTILCHFGQYEKELIPGMYMNADLEITTESAFVIPDDGLVRFEGKQYVYTKSEDDKFEMHEVVVSNTANGFTQISFTDGGDMAGRTFVLSGAYTLLMAMKNTEE